MQVHSVSVTTCVKALEVGNSSLISLTSQELFIKVASTDIKLFGDSQLVMLMTKLCCH